MKTLKKLIGVLSFFFFLYFLYKKAEKIMAFANKVLNDERVSAKLNEMLNDSIVGEMVSQMPTQQEIKQEVQKAVEDVVAPVAKVAEDVKSEVKKEVKSVMNSEAFNLNDRQREIYDLIKTEGEVTMSAILGKVKDVTDRTLRRDMTKLERLGLINHNGKTRDSIYRLRD